ncbi:hypothetical protein X963_4872 [Burkholderia pseudomallei MSHR7498]|nr:hypothetical protein X945_6070 [Burkholderia pseudomallei ABCPW 107]KGS92887.1 hypothetical protein X963_4872 [Burkholderia pseudomallei MSHR7498]
MLVFGVLLVRQLRLQVQLTDVLRLILVVLAPPSFNLLTTRPVCRAASKFQWSRSHARSKSF